MAPVDPTSSSVTVEPVFAIRQYAAADFDHVVDMFVEGMLDYPAQKDTPFMDGYIQRSLDTDLRSIHDTYIARGGNFWVVTPEDDASLIVGMVGLEAKPNREGELRRMSVKRDYRRYGIGRMLLNHLERWAAANGFRKVWLTTGAVMDKARVFYESNGYDEVDIIEMTPTYSAVKFEKKLNQGKAQATQASRY